MNCGDIERELRRVQAEHPGEHLPMETILEALHEDEYGDHLMMPDYEAHVPTGPEHLPVEWSKRMRGPFKFVRHR